MDHLSEFSKKYLVGGNADIALIVLGYLTMFVLSCVLSN